MEPIVLVHGGAGDIPNSRVAGKINGCKLATRIGYKKLQETNCVLDAVEAAVRSMELDETFNCGYGSVLTSEGCVEMEASIQHGAQGKAGCASLIVDIMHPISVARLVMDKTPHNFLAGDGVMRFAKEQGVEVLPPGQLVTEYAKEALEEWRRHHKQMGEVKFARTEIGEVGTVGAVAIDRQGNIAVATSTGGITGKLPGRVGDTPLLGCGTYCDNRFGGVSTTGHGETIMKSVLAHDIIKRIDMLGNGAQKATEDACRLMTERYEGTAGAITIDKNGDVGIAFTSKRMGWAYQRANKMFYGIEKGERHEEPIVD